MYRVIFLIIFAATMWVGADTVENYFAKEARPSFAETASKIGLGALLQLAREGNIAIIDMRQSQGYEHSHIKGALSIHSVKITESGKQPDGSLEKAGNIVLYTTWGVDAQMKQYAENIHRQEKKGVLFYEGGFREWSAAGLPVEGNIH